MVALSIEPDTGSLTIVERAVPGEGAVAWFCLLQTYEPDTAGRAAALLQEPLTFNFDPVDPRGAFEEFDLLIRRYETASGETLPDQLKIGFVHRGIRDGDFQHHLLLQASRLTTYAVVREEIRSVAMTRQSAS